MDARLIVWSLLGGFTFAMLVHYRELIAEAIRRGPWGGGGPPAVGPAPAADPFGRPFAKKRPRGTALPE